VPAASATSIAATIATSLRLSCLISFTPVPPSTRR
jgi:hypothetical protein